MGRWLGRLTGLLLVLGGVLAGPAGAAEKPPDPRVSAGERSAEAFVTSWCRPEGNGLFGCASLSLVSGFRFPALAAEPGSEVVVDTRLAATEVRVRPVPLDGGPAEPAAVAARRIDERRWAFTMPSSTARVGFDIAYADGGSSDSLLILRRIVGATAGPSSVDAYRDVVVWSEREDPPGAEAPSYHLVALIDGSARRLPVAPRSVPFDVDLGPGADWRTVAVYSRCAQEPDPPDALGAAPSAPYPAYTSGRGCDLYRFDFETALERKIAGASTDQATEVLPSIWRDRIAFARVYEQRSGSRGVLPYLYTRDLDGGPSEREPGGARGATGLPGPTSLDLYGRRLAFVWNHRTGETGGVTELRLDTLGAGRRVLSSARHDGKDSYATFLSPQGVHGRIVYGYQRVGVEYEMFAVPEPGGLHTDAVRTTGRSVASLLLRYRITTGDKEALDAPGQLAGVSTTAREGLFVAQRSDLLAADGGTTTIVDVSDLVPSG